MTATSLSTIGLGPEDYGPGPGWPEDRNTLHWLEKRGTSTAVEASVDILSVE